MTTVASHFQKLHEQTARRSGAVRDILAKSEGKYRKAAEAFRARHRTSSLPESPDAELATAFDSIAEDLSELKKLFDEDHNFHHGAMVDVGKSAVTDDLSKNSLRRSDDELMPSRVSAIGALPPGVRLIERTGHVGAREGTHDAPVAPQLAKIVALND